MSNLIHIDDWAFKKLLRSCDAKNWKEFIAQSEQAVRLFLWDQRFHLNTKTEEILGFEIHVENGKVFCFLVNSNNDFIEIRRPWVPKFAGLVSKFHNLQQFPCHFSWLDFNDAKSSTRKAR